MGDGSENQAVVTRERGILASYPVEEVDVIRNTVCKDASDAEMKLYFYDCSRNHVHPLDRLIHFTKRGGKYTPVTSIDFLRMRAGETDEHMGTSDPVYAGEPTTPDYQAKVIVYRWVKGEKCAFEASAKWSAYYPGDALGFMWKKMPELMLGKCAEALALRKAFPKQLHGLYTKDEMEQADTGKLPLTITKEATAQVAETHAAVKELFGQPEPPVSEGYAYAIRTLPTRAASQEQYKKACMDDRLTVDQKTVLGDLFNERWAKK